MKARRVAPADGLYIVGITGGIASGKSLFATYLAELLPAVLVDADLLGHLVLQQPEIERALASAFGDDVLDAEGGVVRGVLGPRAFATPERLKTLNRIVEGPLTDFVERTIQGHAASGFEGLLVLDAALLVEWDKGAWCDLVVAVASDPRLRVERLVARTGLTREEAERRVAAQLPDDARAAYADEVIPNEGTLLEFKNACRIRAAAIQERARAALAARGRLG